MAGCCEREGPGHPVAAPPIRAMNSRRFKLIELHFVAATQGRSAEYRIGRVQQGGVRTISNPVLLAALSRWPEPTRRFLWTVCRLATPRPRPRPPRLMP